MGRISGRQAMKDYIKKYANNGLDFFQLKDDNDSAVVRFLHKDDQDLELYLVHKVEIDGKDKWVECHEENCPICAQGDRPSLKLFIVLYDTTDEKLKVWERGATMVDDLIGFYDKYGDLNNRNYEIIRHGKKNSNTTKYQMLPEDKGPLKDSNGKEIEIPKRLDLKEKKMILELTNDQIAELVAPAQTRDRSAGGSKGNLGF